MERNVSPETIRFFLIRHGKTAGNLKKRYIGRTDEPLCPQGRRELEKKAGDVCLRPQIWMSSPMLRCLETMEILSGKTADPRGAALFSPQMRRTACCIVPDFRECDFGLFENKNYLELSDSAEYQQWIDSNGTLPFPGGEAPGQFRERCCAAFERAADWLIRNAYTSACLVVHGGTIMSIMERYALPRKGYYDWQVKNGEGYQAVANVREWNEGIRNIRLIERTEDDCFFKR